MVPSKKRSGMQLNILYDRPTIRNVNSAEVGNLALKRQKVRSGSNITTVLWYLKKLKYLPKVFNNYSF